MKSAFLILFLILFFSIRGHTKLIKIVYAKTNSTRVEVQESLKKFGYSTESKNSFDYLGYPYEALTALIPDNDRNYSKFLIYISEIQNVSGIYKPGYDSRDKTKTMISLTLKKNVTENEMSSALNKIRRTNAWIVKVNRYMKIIIPTKSLNKYIEKLSTLNLFHSYTIGDGRMTSDTRYFEDLHKIGFVNINVKIPFVINPDYILNEIGKKTDFDIVSKSTLENKDVLITLNVPDRAEVFISLARLFNQSHSKELQGVRIETPKRLVYNVSDVQTPRVKVIFIPKDIYGYLNENGPRETEKRLDQIAVRLHQLGYRIPETIVSPEMGDSYLIHMIIQLNEGQKLDYDKLSKLGDLYITNGQYPGPNNQLNACRSLFL